MTFALIANGQVAEIAAAEFPVAPPLVWIDISSVSPAPSVGWAAAETSGTWTFTAPVVPAAPLVPSALAALTDSDRVIIRCYEHAVAVPAAWQTYRATLREIVSGASGAPTALPTMPAYPAGT